MFSVVLTPLKKIINWYTRRNPVELWLELLRNAEAFEDWEEAALHLDNLLGLDLWYSSNASSIPLKKHRQHGGS
jgi:TAG lipase/lysophosphatidylethanolamine acyltransferase